MELKPMRGIGIHMALVFAFIVIVIVLFVFTFDLPLLAFSPLCFLVFIFINYWITHSRTITFSKDGCRVEWLCFAKMYAWDDLKTKRYERYTKFSNLWERYSPYQHGAVFSPHRVRKAIIDKAATRGTVSLFAFSHIYVYFYPNDGHEAPKKADPLFYTVNETLFRQKMAEWGVDLDERQLKPH